MPADKYKTMMEEKQLAYEEQRIKEESEKKSLVMNEDIRRFEPELRQRRPPGREVCTQTPSLEGTLRLREPLQRYVLQNNLEMYSF